MKHLLPALFLLLVELAHAQTDYRPGTVYLLTGDSVSGEINYRGDLALGEICRFRFHGGDSVKKFTPYDILGYRFLSGKYFISKEVNGQKLFLEYLIQGKVNMYYARNSANNQYFIEKEGLGLCELPYQEMVLYKNDAPYRFKTTKHKGVLNLYMQDAPGFLDRIEKIGEPKKEVLIKLARDYHHEVCQTEECIVFESRPSKIRLDLEPVLGATVYQHTEYLENTNYTYHDGEFEGRTYVRGGLIAHLWLPMVNEKLYLRTGLLISKFDKDNSSKSILKIPIQLEYIYPKGLIRPKFAYGIDLYAPFFYTNGVMAGFNITLNKTSRLSFNYTLDLIPSKFPIIPTTQSFSQTLLAGIYFIL